ncbi:MAG: hypothetical protein ACKVOB_13505 [Sphingomonas sp.]
MANTLTNLAADIYIAADKVGREMVGFIPSVTTNTGSARAAKGDTVRSFFTRAQTVNETDTPSMTIPEGTDQTVDNKTLVLDKYASVQIPWTGEETLHVNNGSGYSTIYGDQIAQAMRTITNKIEVNGFLAAYVASSRAIGTAGTTPFASNHNLIASARQILVDNGCPVEDGQVSLVMNTTAGTNLRNLAVLQKANESGGTELLRQGTLLDLQGVMMKESAGISQHVKGAGTGYDFVTAGEAVGQTALTLEGGTVNTTGFKAGDVITHAGDATNKYIVGTGLTATSGDLIINNPGLLVAGVDANEITIGDSYTPNLMFHRSAIELAMRPPAMPTGGDAADDVMIVQDPWSGLVFEIAFYKGYRKVMIEVRCVYGWRAWKSENISTVLG